MFSPKETEKSKKTIWQAIEENDLDALKALAQLPGFDVKVKNSASFTPLLAASRLGRLDIVKWLLKEGGASIAEKDNNGSTALLLAAANGYLPVVQWLLHSGLSRLDECNHQGQSFWDLVHLRYPTFRTFSNLYRAFLKQPNQTTFDAICAYQKEGQLILQYAVLEHLVSQPLSTLMDNNAHTLHTWYQSLSFCQHLYLLEKATSAKNLHFNTFLYHNACYPDCFPILSIHPRVLRSQVFRKNNWPDLIEYLKQLRFATIEEQTTYISTIDLSGGQLANEYLFELAAVLMNQPQLTRLNLEGNNTLSYFDFQKFITLLKKHPNREHLRVTVTLKKSTFSAQLRSVEDSCLCTLLFHYPDLVRAYRENQPQQFELVLIPTLEAMTKEMDKALLALVVAWSAVMGLFDRAWAWLQKETKITLSELLSLMSQTDSTAAGRFSQQLFEHLEQEKCHSQKALESKQDAFDQLTQQHIKLQQEHNTAQHAIQLNKTTYQETIEQLSEKQIQLSKEKTQAESDLEAVKKEIHQLEEAMHTTTDLKGENTKLQEEVDTLRKREKELSSEVTKLSDQVEVLNEKLQAQTRAQCELILTELKELKSHLIDWEKRQKSANKEVTETKKLIEAQQNKIEFLEKAAKVTRPACLVAVFEGDLATVKSHESEVILSRDQLWRTALHLAVMGNSDLETVSYLLTLPLDHLAKDSFGRTALFYALEAGAKKDAMSELLLTYYPLTEADAKSYEPAYSHYLIRREKKAEQETFDKKCEHYLKIDTSYEAGKVIIAQIDTWRAEALTEDSLTSLTTLIACVKKAYLEILASSTDLSEDNQAGVKAYFCHELLQAISQSKCIRKTVAAVIKKLQVKNDKSDWKEAAEELLSDYQHWVELNSLCQLNVVSTSTWLTEVKHGYEKQFEKEYEDIKKESLLEKKVALFKTLLEQVQIYFSTLLSMELSTENVDMITLMRALQQQSESRLQNKITKLGNNPSSLSSAKKTTSSVPASSPATRGSRISGPARGA